MSSRRSKGLTGEEALGLGVAIAAHAALIAALTLSPLGRKVQPPPQRMTVSLADAVSDQSTSPKPDAQAAPDQAPELGEPDHADQPLPPAPPPPVAKPEPAPKPKPVAKPEPKPEPKPAPKPAPKPKPEPKPEPKAEPKPKPEHQSAPKAKAEPAPKEHDKPAGGDTRAHPHPAKPTGGSRIDQSFLNGIPGSTTPGTDKVSPGDKVGAIPTSALVGLIARKIKPNWTAPQGVDTEKLVTVLSWSLNADGSLAGRPVVVSQSGITDSNRAQAQRHAEMAIRAVVLAAPFPLPAQAYAQWRHVAAFRFDRKLSQ